MTAKQLAERIGVSPQQLDFELEEPCKFCRRVGGNEPPCNKCNIITIVRVQDEC